MKNFGKWIGIFWNAYKKQNKIAIVVRKTAHSTGKRSHNTTSQEIIHSLRISFYCFIHGISGKNPISKVETRKNFRIIASRIS